MLRKHGISEVDRKSVLEGTRPLWEEMRHHRIFMTGGTGFFGCWLLETFLSVNETLRLEATVTVLTRNPAAFLGRMPHLARNPAVTLIKGDIGTFQYPAGEFAYVIHAAADVQFEAGSHLVAGERVAAMIDGTANVLNFAATHGTRKVLFTSSGAVYGPQPVQLNRIGEDFLPQEIPLSVASAYGLGKRASEQICAEYAEKTNFEIKIARCFAFAGPYLALDANFALGNFILDVMHGRNIMIQGDGTATRSYLYAADLAVWLWTILFRAPSMQPVNVGSESAVSIAELARCVLDTLNPSLAVNILKLSVPGALRTRYVPSTVKARELLGLRESVSLEEAIRQMAVWNGIALL